MTRDSAGKREQAEPRHGTVERNLVSGGPAWALCAGLSFGLLAVELWLGVRLPQLVLENSLPPSARSVGAAIVVTSAVLFSAATVFFLRRKPVAGPRAVRWLRPLSSVGLLPPLLTPAIWHAYPLLCLGIAILLSLAIAWWLVPGSDPAKREASGRAAAIARVVLITMIVAYVLFVAVATIEQHRRLETRAYDMGIMENVFWHTTQGRLFESSLEGGSHLGVHTSFIFLLLAPVYALFPRAETLLVVQTVAVGLAAWPLFLLARRLLGSDWSAALVAALYLIHPATAGANFYDFHELAFAPALFFGALYGLLGRRTTLLWSCVALLLLVKEDCSLVVAALGLVALLEGQRKNGAALLATGVVALAVLQGVVIPHFAGTQSSYAWYYTDMIPAGEGPSGLIKTLLLNPLYSLRIALTEAKMLYLLQTLGPALFLCLAGSRGLALVAYGVGMSVLASREYLYVLGFQYAWQLVPQAFAGALIALGGVGSRGWASSIGLTRQRALAAMTLIGVLLALHHGAISPVSRFRSGFRIVRLQGDPTAAERLRELHVLEGLIPPSASVTASETLVPHVARRMRVQTLRYAAESFGRDYDYFLLLRSDVDQNTVARYPYLFDGNGAYALVRQERDMVLLGRKDAPRTGLAR